ncbi:hypothetical protein E2C01_038277 [Portunus trituberculatus]|uniref:Uncharacterized protein n=1 Tax=Portunus trituberculatus TaxID=210409 RepID=A0A5B7FAF3_PORTR|nr:hypothetical protein [Portunus trituberculatus]
MLTKIQACNSHKAGDRQCGYKLDSTGQGLHLSGTHTESAQPQWAGCTALLLSGFVSGPGEQSNDHSSSFSGSSTRLWKAGHVRVEHRPVHSAMYLGQQPVVVGNLQDPDRHKHTEDKDPGPLFS